jgi:hypothetical protein
MTVNTKKAPPQALFITSTLNKERQTNEPSPREQRESPLALPVHL